MKYAAATSMELYVVRTVNFLVVYVYCTRDDAVASIHLFIFLLIFEPSVT